MTLARMFRGFVIGGFVYLMMPAGADAAIVRYSFTAAAAGAATPGVTTYAPDSTAANVMASDLSVAGYTSPGVVSSLIGTVDASTPSYTFDGKAFEAQADTVTNSTNPPATGFYLQFTVTPQAGTPITLNNLSADFGYDENTGNGGTTFNYNLYYSTDGTNFTKAGSTTSVAISGSSGVYNILDDVSKDLSSAFPTPITNLTNPNGVTFRLAMADSNSASSGKHLFIDDIALNDTAPVPEPASLGVIGVAGAMLLGRRRR